VVDRLCQALLENQGLQAALQEVLQGDMARRHAVVEVAHEMQCLSYTRDTHVLCVAALGRTELKRSKADGRA
jgi:hypothetical protein